MQIRVRKKIWLEHRGKPVLGYGRYMLLRHIGKTESLKDSAARLGISYRTAQNYISRMERILGRRIIETRKGGAGAGGSARLNSTGRMLLKKYEAALSG